MKIIVAFFLVLIAGNSALFAQGFLRTPIEGTYLKDFYIVNYLDCDTAKGSFRDAYCGSKSYDGHQGVDFVLRDYKQMDSGVHVLCAAPGTVFKTVDTLFDRNTVGDVALGFGNYIGVRHVVDGKNYYTYYAHIKKNSSKVDSGDAVVAGQPMADVACSGYCFSPHLHFEIWSDSAVIDPFAGPCGNAKTESASLWENPLPYDTVFSVIQHGMFEHIPNFDNIRERPDSKELFSFPQDSTVAFWVESKGVRAADSLEVYWTTPDGTPWFHYGLRSDADYWLHWWWSFIDHPSLHGGGNGAWKATFMRNGIAVREQSFAIEGTVSAPESDAALPTVITHFANVVYVSSQDPHFPNASIRIVDMLGRTISAVLAVESAHTKRLTLPHSQSGCFILCIEQKQRRRSFPLLLR